MKGMNKIKRGTGFRGLLDYLLANEDGPAPGRLIGGSMAGTTPRELAKEFAVSRRLRPDIKKPVWHNSLRLPAGEDASDEAWSKNAEDYLTRMGFDIQKTQYCFWKHDDEAALHIVASRIMLDGSIYYGRQENLISTRVIQQLEKDHGLTITKGPGTSPTPKRKPSKSEIEKALRTGERPAKIVLQDTIDQILDAGPITAPDFIELLKSHGIAARPNIASTGKFSGFSFGLDGDNNKAGAPIFYKGSSLGKAYTAAGLLNRGLVYDPSRDMPLLTGKHPEPAPDYSGDPTIRRKNGGRAFSLIVFMRFEPTTGGQLYRWQSGAPAFVDCGNEISCIGRATDAKIRGMLDLAREKGWARIELSGPRDFQIAATLEAARRGISVSGTNKEIQEIWRREYDRTAEVRKPQPRNHQFDAGGPSTPAGRGLRGLPELNLVPIGAEPELLLQADARRDLGRDEQVGRDPGLRREGIGYGVEARTDPAVTALGAAKPNAITPAAGGPATPAGDRGTANRPATNPGEPAGVRTTPTGDRRAEVDNGNPRQPDPTLGRTAVARNPRGGAWRADGRQEDPVGRDAVGGQEDRPRRIGGGLKALKETPRRPAGEDRSGPAAPEKRPVRVDQEPPERSRPKYPAP